MEKVMNENLKTCTQKQRINVKRCTMGHAGNISALQDKLNGTYPKIHRFQKECVLLLDTHRMNQPLQEIERKKALERANFIHR